MSNEILNLIDELDGLRATRDDAWQIPRVEGDLLYHIALSMRAKTIVEVGTSYGFSGLNWARALKQTGGQLHTIDRDPKKFESSRQTFTRAGVDQIVQNYLGDAMQILSSMNSPIDIAFIDADKPATRAYFDLLWPLIRAGGCIITDNAATHRKELAEFISHVRALPNASSVEVNVGNGIEWTIKVA
jgi:predicted O-methyltransferase YrrM